MDTLRYLKSNSEFYHRMANTSDPNCNTKFPADNIGTRKKVLVDTNEWSRDHQESKARLDAHKEFYNRFKIKQRTMMF